LRDERTDAARKLDVVHALLRGDLGEMRMMLDRIERFVAGLDASARATPDVARAMAAIAPDAPARERYHAFARDADAPPTRARMVALAHRLGWLTEEGWRDEISALVGDRLASPSLGAADIDLACSLHDAGVVAGVAERLAARPPDGVAQAALRACLGDGEARAALLAAFASGNEEHVALAEVYLHRRPIASADEFRRLAASVSRMPTAGAQARALEALARRPAADAQSVAELARLFASSKSLQAQRAIAGILIRSDYRAGGNELLRTLRTHRLKSPDGQDAIDVLIRRLSAES
jgi:hypothetical protein